MLFKLSYLSLNFALTLGYLNPASNNPASSPSKDAAMSALRRQRGDWEGVRENNANRFLLAYFYSLYHVVRNSGFTKGTHIVVLFENM